MNEEKSFDWIGLLIIVFFLIFPLINTFFAKKKEKPPAPRRAPKQKIIPPQVVRKPPPVPARTRMSFAQKAKDKKRKKILTKYGSLRSGIILSEILKRPYID
ncbi:MAG: hypothetical protein PVI40_05535 [Chlamydiota bacterium]|jgi:hypothetical protein